MLDQPCLRQGVAPVPAEHRESPNDGATDLGQPSVTRRRPLDDWTATQIAWPVKDRDLAAAHR